VVKLERGGLAFVSAIQVLTASGLPSIVGDLGFEFWNATPGVITGHLVVVLDEGKIFSTTS